MGRSFNSSTEPKSDSFGCRGVESLETNVDYVGLLVYWGHVVLPSFVAVHLSSAQAVFHSLLQERQFFPGAAVHFPHNLHKF